jgi:hypothetical protein
MKTILIAALTLCIGFAATAEAARYDRVKHLGSTRLSLAENDIDVLRFRSCRNGIHAIQLRSSRGQVEIERLWVRYANGERDNLNVRDRISQGGATRWIDLRGGDRCVVEIGIVGDTELSRDRARVDIWGR